LTIIVLKLRETIISPCLCPDAGGRLQIVGQRLFYQRLSSNKNTAKNQV